MDLFHWLVSAYIVLSIIDEVAAWVYGKVQKRIIGTYDRDELPRSVHDRAVKVTRAKSITKTAIRVLQILIAVPTIAAVIVGLGMLILRF